MSKQYSEPASSPTYTRSSPTATDERIGPSNSAFQDTPPLCRLTAYTWRPSQPKQPWPHWARGDERTRPCVGHVHMIRPVCALIQYTTRSSEPTITRSSVTQGEPAIPPSVAYFHMNLPVV